MDGAKHWMHLQMAMSELRIVLFSSFVPVMPCRTAALAKHALLAQLSTKMAVPALSRLQMGHHSKRCALLAATSHRAKPLKQLLWCIMHICMVRFSAFMQLIRTALNMGRARPADVSGIEMHGTGTSLGDPIEMGAVHAVLQVNTSRLPLLPVPCGIHLAHRHRHMHLLDTCKWVEIDIYI